MTQTPTPDAYQAACRAVDKHRERADRAEALLNQTTAALSTALHWARVTDDPQSVQELGGCLYALKDAVVATGRRIDPVADYPHLAAARAGDQHPSLPQ